MSKVAGEAKANLSSTQDFSEILHLLDTLLDAPIAPEIPDFLAHNIEFSGLYHKILELRSAMDRFSRGDFSCDLRMSGACAGYLKALQVMYVIWIGRCARWLTAIFRNKSLIWESCPNLSTK